MEHSSSLRERAAIFAATYLFWVVAYVQVGELNSMRHPRMIAWDPARFVPTVSVFVIPYLSAYVMPFVLLFVLRDRRAYRRFAAALAGTIAACSLLYFAFPLTIARPQVGTVSIFDRLLRLVYEIDKPTNLFPSLHVAMASLFALGIARERPRWKTGFYAWAGAIAVSTLFTRQHYAIDAIGGIAIAWVAWRIFLKMTK